MRKYLLLDSDPGKSKEVVKIEVRQLGIPKVVIVNRPKKKPVDKSIDKTA